MAAKRFPGTTKRRPLAWKIGVAIAIVYAIAQWYNSDTMHDYCPVKTEIDVAIAAIPLKENWQALKPASNAEQNYTYDLDYKRVPEPGEARADAEMIAGVVVSTLQHAGANRLLQSAPLAVFTGSSVDASLGKSSVKGYGYATYDTDHGDIVWKPPTP